MSNECTFINPNSPTSQIKTELQYEQSTNKVYDDIELVHAHHSSCTVHTAV